MITSSRRNHVTSSYLLLIFKTSFNVFWMQSDEVSPPLSTNSPKDVKLTMILLSKSSHWTRAELILVWCSGDITCMTLLFTAQKRNSGGWFWRLFSEEFTDPLLLNCSRLHFYNNPAQFSGTFKEPMTSCRLSVLMKDKADQEFSSCDLTASCFLLISFF